MSKGVGGNLFIADLPIMRLGNSDCSSLAPHGNMDTIAPNRYHRIDFLGGKHSK